MTTEDDGRDNQSSPPPTSSTRLVSSGCGSSSGGGGGSRGVGQRRSLHYHHVHQHHGHGSSGGGGQGQTPSYGAVGGSSPSSPDSERGGGHATEVPRILVLNEGDDGGGAIGSGCCRRRRASLRSIVGYSVAGLICAAGIVVIVLFHRGGGGGESVSAVSDVGGGTTSLQKSAAELAVTKDENVVIGSSHDRSVVPTLLSVREVESGSGVGAFVHAPTNPLYSILRSSFGGTASRAAGGEEILDLVPPFELWTERRKEQKKKERLFSANDLFVDKNQVRYHDPIEVSWVQNEHFHDVDNVRDDDVIALYCPADEPDPTKFRDAATVRQAAASSSDAGGGAGGVGHAGNFYRRWRIASFPVVREEDCEFRLLSASVDADLDRRRSLEEISGDDGRSERQMKDTTATKKLTLVSRTGPIRILHGLEEPTGIHLALSEVPDSMRVHFTTGGEVPNDDSSDSDASSVARPVVVYWKTDDDSTSEVGREDVPLPTPPLGGGSYQSSVGTTSTYDATDLCGAPANEPGAGRFVPPGMLHVASMDGLEPDTEYSYKVGLVHDVEALESDHIVWSDVFSFQSPVEVGGGAREQEQKPFSFIVYGDQGCPEEGWVSGAERTERLMEREVRRRDVRAIHHFGDLSYAEGAAHIWDDWSHMIQPLAARVPLMIGVGNHEYDHTAGGGPSRDPSGLRTPGGYSPSWGNYGDDSQGECGVPTSRRFVMPRTGNGVFWYSHEYGTVHVAMLSSEHDMSPGSEQYRWLERDLAAVDRTRTPWVILECHRPMYHSQIVLAEDWSPRAGEDENQAVALGLRREFEVLLKRYGVDLFLSGHYHSYLRTCRGLYEEVCDNGGPMHVTVGSAGAELLPTSDLYEQGWTEKFLLEWGYGRVTVANESALHFEFVSEEEGAVHDEAWLYK